MVWAFISLDWIVYPIWITSNIIRIAFTIHWMGDQRYFHLMLKTTSYKGQIFYYKEDRVLSGLYVMWSSTKIPLVYQDWLSLLVIIVLDVSIVSRRNKTYRILFVATLYLILEAIESWTILQALSKWILIIQIREHAFRWLWAWNI